MLEYDASIYAESKIDTDDCVNACVVNCEDVQNVLVLEQRRFQLREPGQC